jgi:CrcB protein
MTNVLAVGFGGFLGAVSRYMISLLCNKKFSFAIPFATLFVNVLGGILIGFIMEYSKNSAKLGDNLRLFITTGFLGGLTTFSTFSYETIALFEKGSYTAAGLNTVLNLILSLIGAYIGILVARAVRTA